MRYVGKHKTGELRMEFNLRVVVEETDVLEKHIMVSVFDGDSRIAVYQHSAITGEWSGVEYVHYLSGKPKRWETNKIPIWLKDVVHKHFWGRVFTVDK